MGNPGVQVRGAGVWSQVVREKHTDQFFTFQYKGGAHRRRFRD